ncbi:acetate--CoA ligase family protein [Humitalea sp. 24SJ18S-53]|uniref:acetate--CoA ligase family protein n=1 Tax=Humitalea sp. 24SJ18S-53 TaxID=3422307 RepID=UPI003D6796BD
MLNALLAPRSIAVVGASERPSPGRAILTSLDRLGFAGDIWPVHPRSATVLGHACYPSLSALPGVPDVVAFCMGNDRLPAAFREAAERGVKSAVIYSAGFAEIETEAGRQLADKITGLAKEAGIALCGPNCMGVLSPASRSSVYLHEVFDPEKVTGNVGLISQSGSICIGLVADCRRYGFSHVISTGNEMVLTTEDFMDALIDDAATKVIALFTESVRRPERFVAALDRAADAGKPVVVLKVGKTARAQHAITTHTGGLAGEAGAFSAVLRAHRAIEVDDPAELAEVLAACQGRHMPRGRRLAIVTGSGGQTELILDLAEQTPIVLDPMAPADRAAIDPVIGGVPGEGNPLDAWGNGKPDVNYPHSMQVLGASAHCDAVAFCGDGMDGHPLDDPAEDLPYAEMVKAAAAGSQKPFYYLSTRAGVFRTDQEAVLRPGGVAMLSGVLQGLRAISRLADWGQPRAPLRAGPGLRPAAIDTGRATIHEYDAKRMLAKAGVATVPEHLAQTLPDALAAARSLGFPVVLKVVADAIAHKSELSLLELRLTDDAAVTAAWGRLQDRLGAIAPAPDIAGILVQPMVSDGVEVLAGISNDPEFGPIMAFGLGGTLVEIFRDVVLRPLPLRAGEAEAMIAETRIASVLLAGARGAPPADVPALAASLYALSDFAIANAARIAEIDVNPIKVLPLGRGCMALDAVILPKP